MALCVLFAWRLTRGDTGRSLRAVRDNGLIAESLGVNLAPVRLAAFTTSAGFAGFGGGLFAIVNGYVSPELFQMTKSFDFLVGSIVGGITSISGSLHRRAVHRVPARLVGRHEHRAVRPNLWRGVWW